MPRITVSEGTGIIVALVLSLVSFIIAEVIITWLSWTWNLSILSAFYITLQILVITLCLGIPVIVISIAVRN